MRGAAGGKRNDGRKLGGRGRTIFMEEVETAKTNSTQRIMESNEPHSRVKFYLTVVLSHWDISAFICYLCKSSII